MFVMRFLGIYIQIISMTGIIGVIASNKTKPNIIIILADDLGFDDISFRGLNYFLTPNIDALAYNGVILNNLYASYMCTPSRAALLTGKYPIHTGMQHYVIPNYSPGFLPLNETTMPEIFQRNGYFTSLLGKWHLGMSRRAYTPTMRGFNKHFGYLGAYIDYYDHTLYAETEEFARGHDFRDNLEINRKRSGTYITELLTEEAVKIIKSQRMSNKPLFLLLSHLAPHAGNENDPLQAPKEEVKKFLYITNPQARIYAAMISLLDKSVGIIVDALNQTGILQNTIILFCSDNGGPTLGLHSTGASNYPLRGQKYSPWEGAVRSSAAIWSSQLKNPGTIWKQKLYIADLFPTLAAAANIDLKTDLNLDGINFWKSLVNGSNPIDREIVHNIDLIDNYISYANGKWKYINGTTLNGQYDSWIGSRPSPDDNENDPRARNYEDLIRNTTVWKQLNAFNINHKNINISQLREMASVVCNVTSNELNNCNPLLKPCLFNIDDDPCEKFNLYDYYKNSTFLLDMLERIEEHRRNAHSPNNKPTDPRCNPANYKYEWTWWEDLLEDNSTLLSDLSDTVDDLSKKLETTYDDTKDYILSINVEEIKEWFTNIFKNKSTQFFIDFKMFSILIVSTFILSKMYF